MREWLLSLLLGYVTSLGGVDLQYGHCYVDRDTGAATLCEFDENRCAPSPPGCGREMSQFTDRIFLHNEKVLRCGLQHCPGWTLRFAGSRIDLDPSAPFRLNASRVDIDCRAATFRTTSAEIPVVPGPSIDAGDVALPLDDPSRLNPGDVLFDPVSHYQVPVRSVTPNAARLAWSWTGPPVDATLISTGALVIQTGQAISFSNGPCPIYQARSGRWPNRVAPMTVVRNLGNDSEDGWCTWNFNHPGDFDHAAASSAPGGGVYGLRFTGCTHKSHGAVVNVHGALLNEGYPPEGLGAAFLVMANTIEMDLRRTQNVASRCFAVAAGDGIKLRGACEGPLQMLWAPQGVGSLMLTETMSHQNQVGPLDLPWIDLGENPGPDRTVANIRAGFSFFRWGTPEKRSPLVRARGNPVILTIDGVFKHAGKLFDLPPASVIRGRVWCTDRTGMRCER